jgi:hypothetical protein
MVSSDDSKVQRSPVPLIISSIRKDKLPKDETHPDPKYAGGPRSIIMLTVLSDQLRRMQIRLSLITAAS